MAAAPRPIRLLSLVLAFVLTVGGVTALTVEPARAAVTFVGAASASSGGGNTITIPQPAGLQAGDVMLASIAFSSSGTITAPAGWIFVRRDQQGSVLSQELFYRVATGAEPASYLWTTSFPEESAGAISAYRGVDNLSPIDVHGGQANVASTSYLAPSITTTVSNTLLVGFFGSISGGPTNPPLSMTERADQGSGTGATEIADEILGAPGPTGSRTATGASSPSVGQLVALAPFNDPPTDIALDPADVDENVAVGTAVGTFTTTDPNPADTHTYALVAGVGDTHNGLFAIAGDELRTNAPLDFESLPASLLLRVETTDSGIRHLTFARPQAIIEQDQVCTRSASRFPTQIERARPLHVVAAQL